VEVRIGVTYSAKEISVDMGDSAALDAVKSDVEAALTGSSSVLWLVDKRGRVVGVAAEKLAYVELDPTGDDRRVGFGIS
jgi:hypothetical protein